SSISLVIGFISVGIAAAAGTTVGLVAGYDGGRVDALLMRGMDVMLAFPGILLALAIVSVLGPSLRNLMIAVGVSGIPYYARLVHRPGEPTAHPRVGPHAERGTGLPPGRVVDLDVSRNGDHARGAGGEHAGRRPPGRAGSQAADLNADLPADHPPDPRDRREGGFWMRDTVLIEEMTWPEVRDAIAHGKRRVIVMLGAME